ncbi:MAG: RNA polymerase sigma factor [Chloroflexota bacterium]|nr:RNA polymerase sigma factor [Chloroflexota bacterium]
MKFNDAELVSRLKKREAEAVDELLAQYTDRLYNYAYYHSGDHHLAEDIVSETFTRVIEKVDGYVQRDVPFKAWLFRIAHNLLVDHFRRRKRYNSVSLDAVDWDSGPSAAAASDWGAGDGGEIAEQLGEREEIQRAIALLPEDQRTVFILRFVQGFELEQVAAMLDKSLVSIKSLQYRAVRNLRRHLGDKSSKSITAEDTAG